MCAVTAPTFGLRSLQVITASCFASRALLYERHGDTSARLQWRRCLCWIAAGQGCLRYRSSALQALFYERPAGSCLLRVTRCTQTRLLRLACTVTAPTLGLRSLQVTTVSSHHYAIYSSSAIGRSCCGAALPVAQMSGLGLMSELGSLHIKIVLGVESMRTCCALRALVHERYSSAAVAACVRRDGGDAWGTIDCNSCANSACARLAP